MLDVAMRALARRRRYHAWVQWIGDAQWQRARAAAVRHGVRLYGDLPFLLSYDSADVWARQAEFRLDATVGAPPDVFDPEGQDWGLPPMVWDTMAAGDYAWWRARCARTGHLFDGARLDHVVGYYRIWQRPAGCDASFCPPDEPSQRALGELLLDVARAAAGPIDLIAEDLGSIPAFVRASLAELAMPGYRVLRWEDDAGVFRDPLAWPECSVATSGTHDTSSMATWWSEELRDDERAALARVPCFAPLAVVGRPWTPLVHESLLDGLYAARSALVILPFPDAYGGTERINVPSTVAETNWAYRIPWTVTALRGTAGAPLRDAMRARATRHGRA
jgi:4-alpha-glucanotransferase